MKKSLLVGIGSLLLFTGCCCKSGECNGGLCADNKPVEQILPKPLQPVSKPEVVKKPLIKTVKYGNKTCVIDNTITHKQCVIRVEAQGVGIVPCNGSCSTAQAKMMARRAAILDGYRALIEKIYGIEINGRDSVKNMTLQSSFLKSHIQGIVRGANIEEESFQNGVYKVIMSIKLNVANWNKYLASDTYSYNSSSY